MQYAKCYYKPQMHNRSLQKLDCSCYHWQSIENNKQWCTCNWYIRLWLIHISINLFRKKVIKGLHKVIKCSFLSGKFPTVWKKARVTAVYNKGSKKSCSNYRPISLISIPSKVVEYLICSQINDHLTTFYLQNKHQWGFRNKRSNDCTWLKNGGQQLMLENELESYLLTSKK